MNWEKGGCWWNGSMLGNAFRACRMTLGRLGFGGASALACATLTVGLLTLDDIGGNAVAGTKRPSSFNVAPAWRANYWHASRKYQSASPVAMLVTRAEPVVVMVRPLTASAKWFAGLTWSAVSQQQAWQSRFAEDR